MVVGTPMVELSESDTVQVEEELVIPKRPVNVAFHLDYGKVLTLPFPFEYKVEGGIVLEFLERIEAGR